MSGLKLRKANSDCVLWSPLVLLLFILRGKLPIDMKKTGADPAQIVTATQGVVTAGCGHSRVWSKGVEKKRKWGNGNLEIVQGGIDRNNVNNNNNDLYLYRIKKLGQLAKKLLSVKVLLKIKG